jgi:ribose-phosphate pyrophosphokinase
VLIDDMVDTANTLCKAAGALKEHGATAVRAYCTHPVLSGEAVSRINGSEMDEVVVTDTIQLSDEAKASSKIRQLTVSHLLGESIRRITVSDSVSSLFSELD